jgi:hypothetical protein
MVYCRQLRKQTHGQHLAGDTEMATATRAPKGGIEIMGVFYKGGQFLPQYAPKSDDEKTSQTNKSKYLKSKVTKTTSAVKLYKGDKVITDKNGFKTIRRGMWYRLNIGCA